MARKHSSSSAVAERPARTAKTKIKTKALARPRPSVHYPALAETVKIGDYTIRIGAPEAVQGVEIRIDGGPWLSCRPAAGFWWYDWAGFLPGEHDVLARALFGDGDASFSDPQIFEVIAL